MRALLVLLAAHAAHAAVVEGRVLSVAGNTPVAHAMVTLTGAGSSYTAETSSGGVFHIEGVTPGVYRPLAQRRGFVPPAKPPEDLIVAEGEEAVRLDIHVVPSAVISGRVLDADGDPLSNVQVQALQYGYSSGFPQLQTRQRAASNDRGEFRLYDLRPGRYFVRAGGPVAGNRVVLMRSGAMNAVNPSYYPGVPGAAGAAQLEVAPGAELGGIDIRVREETLFSFRARVPPVGTLFPMLQREKDAELLVGFSAHTKDNVLEFANLAPGSYVLTAQWAASEGPEQRLFARQQFDIVDRDVDMGELKLVKGVVVSGTVEGAREGVSLALWPVNPSPQPHPRSVPDAKNGFRFEAVAPDAYWLRVTTRPGSYLQAIRSAGREWTTQKIDLSRDAEPIAVALATDGGEVAGLVTDAEGNPCNRALVALVPTQNGWPDRLRTIATDAHGNFRIEDIAAGEYKLFAWDDAEPGAAASAEFRQPSEHYAVPIAIAADSSRTVTLKVIPSPMGR